MTLEIRPASGDDETAIWSILEPMIRTGETYSLPRDMTRAAALAYWSAPGHAVFVADAAGRGVARAMCAHSLDQARTQGFRAMQFNFVVSTNTRAVALWQHMGFDIVGLCRARSSIPARDPWMPL